MAPGHTGPERRQSRRPLRRHPAPRATRPAWRKGGSRAEDHHPETGSSHAARRSPRGADTRVAFGPGLPSRRGLPSKRSLRSGRRGPARLWPGVTRRHSRTVRPRREDQRRGEGRPGARRQPACRNEGDPRPAALRGRHDKKAARAPAARRRDPPRRRCRPAPGPVGRGRGPARRRQDHPHPPRPAAGRPGRRRRGRRPRTAAAGGPHGGPARGRGAGGAARRDGGLAGPLRGGRRSTDPAALRHRGAAHPAAGLRSRAAGRGRGRPRRVPRAPPPGRPGARAAPPPPGDARAPI